MKNPVQSVTEFIGVAIMTTLFIIFIAQPIKYRILMGAHELSPEEYKNAIDASGIYNSAQLIRAGATPTVGSTAKCRSLDTGSDGFTYCKVFRGQEELSLECPYQFPHEQVSAGDASCRLSREETEREGEIQDRYANFQ